MGDVRMLEKRLNAGPKPELRDIEEALLTAIQSGHDDCTPPLIVAGARRLDCALYLAIQLERVKAIAILLLCKATITGDCQSIRSLLSEPPDCDNMPWYMNTVHDFLSQGELKMSYPIAVSIMEKNYEATKELLLKTDHDMRRKQVDWSKLKLTLLHPSWVYSIAPWVVTLKLVNNHLRKLPNELFTATQLRRLELSHNLLEIIPAPIFALPNLEYLTLSHNRLKEIPNTFNWSPSLLSLDLSENELQTLPPGIQESSVEILNLSKNQFSTVPKCLCRIRTLTSLDLSSMPITSLPKEMENLEHLVNLNVTNANISDLPGGGILRGGIRGIFRARARSNKPCNYVKLIVLCHSDNAKMMMYSRLKHSGVTAVPNDMETFQWSYRPIFTKKFFNNQRLYFNTWLIGSTSNASSIYPCFFTSSALYVIVWDMTKTGEMREQIKLYVDLISRYIPVANILVIAILPEPFETWADANADNLHRRLTSFFSKSSYRGLVYQGLILMASNSSNKEGQVDIRQRLYDVASTMTVNGQQLIARNYPESYFALIPVLEKEQHMFQVRRKPGVLEENAIWKLFDQAPSSDPLDRMELPVIINFLQNAGFLMHYEDPNDRLDQYCFTRPDWLYNTLLRVIHHALQHSHNLVLTYGDLCTLTSVDGSKNFSSALVRLMVRFAIVLPLKGSHFLVPALLPHCNLPASQLCTGTLRRQFAPKSKALPTDLWYRIVCRVLSNLSKVVEFREVRRKVNLKEPFCDTEELDDHDGTDDETDAQGSEKLRKKPSLERGKSEPVFSEVSTRLPLSVENASSLDQIVKRQTFTRLGLVDSRVIEESTEDVCLLPTPENTEDVCLLPTPGNTPEIEKKSISHESEPLTGSEESHRNFEPTTDFTDQKEEATANGTELSSKDKEDSCDSQTDHGTEQEPIPNQHGLEMSSFPILSAQLGATVTENFPLSTDDKSVSLDTRKKPFEASDGSRSSSLPEGATRPRLQRIASVPSKKRDKNTSVMEPIILEQGTRVWNTGILYDWKDVRFSIYPCLCEMSSVEERGIEVCSTRNTTGRIVMARLCWLIQKLLEERYPELFSVDVLLQRHELTQLAVCPVCLERKQVNPTYFLVEACVHALKDKDMHNCRYHAESIPPCDLIPDYLMVDFPPSYQLTSSSFQYSESRPLHSGRRTLLHAGTFQGESIAVKVQLTVDGKSITLPLSCVRQEIEMLVHLQHPNIVRTFGFCLHPPCVLLERAPHGNLYQKLMDMEQKISRSIRYHLSCQVASALEYLHKLDIVYRTLKASSVLVWSLEYTDEVNVKLANLERGEYKSASGLLGRTTFAAYPAPEMLRYLYREEYSEKVDIYSFGILLYELVTRWQPFGGIHSSDRFPSSHRPKLSGITTTGYTTLVQLMQECWQEDMTLRPSASNLVQQLCQPAFHCHLTTQVLRDCISVRGCCFVPSVRQIWVYGEHSPVSSYTETEIAEGTQIFILNADNLTVQGSLELRERASAIFTIDNKVWVGMTEACVHAYDTATFKFTDRFYLKDSVTVIADNDTYAFVGQANGQLTYYPKLNFPKEAFTIDIGKKAIIAMIPVGNDIWLSCGNEIVSLNADEDVSVEERWEGCDKRDQIYSLVLSTDGTMVWSLTRGNCTITSWDVSTSSKKHSMDLQEPLKWVCCELNYDPSFLRLVSLVCVNDTLWLGLTCGVIVILSATDQPKKLAHFRAHKNATKCLMEVPLNESASQDSPFVLSGGYGEISSLSNSMTERNGVIMSWQALSAADFQLVWKRYLHYSNDSH